MSFISNLMFKSIDECNNNAKNRADKVEEHIKSARDYKKIPSVIVEPKWGYLNYRRKNTQGVILVRKHKMKY